MVVDPLARAVTHLVVGPEHPARLADLFLLTLPTPCGRDPAPLHPGRVRQALAGPKRRTSCRRAASTRATPRDRCSPGPTTAWGPPWALGMGNLPQTVTYDSVPLGEVEVRRGEHVHATDGAIGRVQGLVIDPRDHHVTHVLLQEGHLRGRKDVAIPISAVAAPATASGSASPSRRCRICRRWTSTTRTGVPASGEDTDDRSGHRLGSGVRRAVACRPGLQGAAAGGLRPR